MEIEVKLFANFRKGRFVKEVFKLEKGTSISDIIEMLEINEDDTGIIFINGRHAKPDYILCKSDILSLFPVVGGG
jgi:sulfur carrier protein